MRRRSDAVIQVSDPSPQGSGPSSAPVVVIREPGRSALYLIVHDPLEVGRDCAGVLVADAEVSRRHVVLHPVAGGIEIRDLGSRNGSSIDGVSLDGQRRLDPGSTLRIGNTTVELAGSADAPQRRADVQEATAIEMIAEQVDAASAAVLARRQGDQGTVTLLFSDIEQSTARAVELGDQRWFSVLSRHNRIVRDLIPRFGGTEIKAQGDGFMLAFPSARQALQFSASMQREITAASLLGDEAESIRVRIGLHTGEVIVDDDGDLFGRHVNMAARVAGEANGAEILVSSLLREIVEPRGDVEFGQPREVRLKGIPGMHTVHPVEWSTAPGVSPVR